MTGPRSAGPRDVGGELRQTVAEVMAGEEVRGLQRRLVMGEIDGDPVAEVTARHRPDGGIISGLLLVAASVVVAFIVGFASIAINDAKASQGATPTSTVTP